MALIRTLFWVVLFIFFTFAFVVLFEYGTHDFVPGFKKEFARATSALQAFAKQADKSSEKKK
jgi:hypothetical protein